MIKSIKQSGRGGKRLGAGRPPKWSTSDFKTIRVPVALAPQVLEIARYLDGQQDFRELQTFENEESSDYDGAKAMQFNYLHRCAEILGTENKRLRWEIESLKAQLKSVKKQKFIKF
jgi:hypothetical protein